MQITVHTHKGVRVVEGHEGQTVLEVLQNEGERVSAACGGKGTCGKCALFIRDSTGLSKRLSCRTPVTEGMEVHLEDNSQMRIAEDGFACPFSLSAGQQDTYGVAIDIGTTTMVCHLHDLVTGRRLATVSSQNPQVAFGADVISRIDASQAGKLDQLVEVLGTELSTLADKVCAQSGIAREKVVRASIAGNTVMEHFVCGLSPDSIGVTPFKPLSLFGAFELVSALGVDTFLAPAISGYVGGDITAGLLVNAVDRAPRPCLYIDIGTNGEMAIGCADRLVCCATAAGPAFEGANIEFGMPASPGAISEVEYRDGALLVHTIGDGVPQGICGSGLIDALACALRMGVIDETGYLLGADEAPEHAASALGIEDDAHVFYLTQDKRIYLTQGDVRNLQLVKSAIHAGIMVLLDEYGIAVGDIEELIIAGGFGSYIDLASAACIGLFPHELLEKARAVGNAAGEGASALLVSEEARDRVTCLADTCEYVELSTSRSFNGYFIDMLEFDEEPLL